ncbi:MAG: HAMP domain-containing histidine kinase, partial [Actinomycetota bacterium]|nr:HAMP domain-containing histidine kinase [Actinomycetota bacterium]
MQTIPPNTAVLRRSPSGVTTIEGTNFSVNPPVYDDGLPHWGVVSQITWASVPTSDGGWVTVMQPSPSRGSLGRMSATLGFLQSMLRWLLLAGGVAALIALVIARWLARGMTQPLRDMAAAARRMEVGDYTGRVHTRSRDEVGQLAAAFNRMSAELEVLERSRRDLVANVSHELKTPITAIRAHLENLADGVERPDRETLQVMLGQTERLGRLVDQLLDLSRLESGEVPLQRQPFALAVVIGDVISEFSVGRSVEDVTLRSDVADDLFVEADEERIHQVVFNLVDNAVRFTPPGGAVTITAAREGGRVRVQVADTGVGVGSEHLPRLFERFYRADPSRSRDDGSGTGIGLAIARSIVEGHGGRIAAESERDNGATFTFDLPAADAAVPVTDRRTAP